MIFESNGHFYTQDGNPAHDADLRRARKENLLRSVTSIDKAQFPNPALDNYKLEQLAKAAFLNPLQPHETIEDYTKRLIEQSWEHRDGAADFGTRLHNAIDKLPEPPPDDLIAFVDKVTEWQKENIISVIESESVVVDLDIGVAGRKDQRVLHKVHGIITLDFKTQGVKRDKKTNKKKPGFYESWVRQLGFYESVDAKKEGRYPNFSPGLSVVIDSSGPSLPYTRVWTAQEMKDGYEEFLIGAYQYYKNREYWPVGKWKLEDKLTELHK